MAGVLDFLSSMFGGGNPQSGPQNVDPNILKYASLANPNGHTPAGLTGQFPDAPGVNGMLGPVGRAMGTNDGGAGPTAFGGLLNFKDEDSKQAALRGLLGASANLMAAGGPSDKPTSFLGNLGGAIGAGTSAYDQYGQNKADLAYKQAQIDRSKIANAQDAYKMQQAQKAAAARQAMFGGGNFDGGSSASATTGPASAGASSDVGSASTNNAAPAANNDLAGQINAQRQKYEKLYNGLMAVGDGENARPIFAQMNNLDNEAAKQGLVWNGTQYTAAPGYNQGLQKSEFAKSSGRIAGEESQVRTNEQRNFDREQADPAFAAQMDQQRKEKLPSRYSNPETFFDKNTSQRVTSAFDNQTGRMVYFDTAGNQISGSAQTPAPAHEQPQAQGPAQPSVLNTMEKDSAGRGKLNMSDPVVKDERNAEASLAQAAGRTSQTLGTLDRMQTIAGDINRNSWFGTGGYNGFAKTLDSVLPGDNFSGSKRQELDNLMQDQVKTEIESLRGLGAMSDRDLASIQDRVLNGNLNPAALKDIAQRLRGIAQYNAAKFEAWKSSGQTDDFRNWAYNFDKDNYENFMANGGGSRSETAAPASTDSAGSQNVPQIQNVEDFTKLAPGTTYKDPQGKIRVKQ